MTGTKLRNIFTAGLIIAGSASTNASTISTSDGVITTTAGTATYNEVGTYVSGGDGLTGRGTVWPLDVGDGLGNVSQEASNVDQFWLNFNSSGAGGPGAGSIIYNFNNATSDILAIAGVDHDPLTAYEALEFIVWGSQTGAVWEEGTITAIFEDGVDAGWVFDDLSSVWSFSEAYTIFAVSGGTHYTGAGTCSACIEGEIDAIAAWQPTVVPVPAAGWLFGSALAGLGLSRRRRKRG